MSFKGKNGGVPEFDSKEGYEKYASVYDRTDAAFLDTFDKKLLMRNLRNFQGKKILDVGVGTGRLGALLKSRGAENIIGSDISRAMLNVAQKKKSYTELREWDVVEEVPEDWEEYFDVIVSSLLLVHIPHRQLLTVCKNLYNALAPGGILWLVNIPQRRSPILTSKQGERFYIASYHHADDTVLEQLVEAGFIVESADHTLEKGDPIATLYLCRKE